MEYTLLPVLGIVLSVIGVMNIRGNISAIHSYNRKKVREEDVPKYGRAVGTGTLIIGLGLIAAFAAGQWNSAAQNYILVPAFVVGFGFILYGQLKYNKGLF